MKVMVKIIVNMKKWKRLAVNGFKRTTPKEESSPSYLWTGKDSQFSDAVPLFDSLSKNPDVREMAFLHADNLIAVYSSEIPRKNNCAPTA